MTTDINGGGSAPFNTQIPQYTENADIQAALRIYHYGSDTQNPNPLPDESIAGHLNTLTNNKMSVPVAISGLSTNLNDYTSPGLFHQSSTTNARSGTNYPTYLSQAYSGMLEVYAENAGTIVYQTYHMSDSINQKFWRLGVYASEAWTWSAWTTFVNQITGSASTIVTQDLTANRALITNAGQKVAVSGVSAAELATLQGSTTTTTVQNQLNIRSTVSNTTGQITGHRVFIQELEPNGTRNPGYTPQDGDLWFW